MTESKYVYEVRPRKDRCGVQCGYKGQRVGPRYRSVNKFHTAKLTHAGLSQANWTGIGIACARFCSGGNNRLSHLSGVGGGNFLISEDH